MLFRSKHMEQDFEELFDHKTPTENQQEKIAKVRAAAKAFARVLQDDVPPSADRSAALRLLREAAFTANAAIIFG